MTDDYIRKGFRFPANSFAVTGPPDLHQGSFSASYAHDTGADLDDTIDDNTLVEILPRAGGTVSVGAAGNGARSHSCFPSGEMDQAPAASEPTRKDKENSTNNSNSKSRRLREVQNSSIFNASVSVPSQQTMNFVTATRSESLGSPKEDEETKLANMDASINPRIRASAIRQRTQNKQLRPSRNVTPHGGSGRVTPVTSSTTHLTAYRGSGIEEALMNLEDQDQVAGGSPSRRVSLTAGTARLSPRASVNDWSRSYSESIGVSSAEMVRYFSLYRTPSEKVRRDSIQSTSDISCTRPPQVGGLPVSPIPAAGGGATSAVTLGSKSMELDLEQQVSDLQKRVSLLEGQNRSLHIQNQHYELRLEELEKKITLLMPNTNKREGTASTSPSPPRMPDATEQEDAPTRAPSKAATTETTYTRV